MRVDLEMARRSRADGARGEMAEAGARRAASDARAAAARAAIRAVSATNSSALDGRTAVHLAAQHGNAAVLRLLLSAMGPSAPRTAAAPPTRAHCVPRAVEAPARGSFSRPALARPPCSRAKRHGRGGGKRALSADAGAGKGGAGLCGTDGHPSPSTRT